MKGNAQPVPQSEVAAGSGVRGRFREFEDRLGSMPPRRLAFLAVAVSLLFLALGVVLGILLVPYSPTPLSDTDLSAPQTSSSATVSQTGVLRQFNAPQDEIEFYLEKSDSTQVLLMPTAQLDSSLLESFVGLFVTVEGTAGKSADGTKDVLLVERIVLKR